jgi:uncharacterized sulfatase
MRRGIKARDPLLFIIAAMVMLPVSATEAQKSLSAEQRRPNILFIAADDLNNDLACYGHPLIKSPNIDRLAARGILFDRAYCQFPLCNPSRTSLMTGLRPDSTKVYDLVTHFRETLPDVVTLPQLFRRNGYFTARVGKIYHYGNPNDIGTNGLDDEPSWNVRVNPRGVDKDEESVLTNHTPQRVLGNSLSLYASPAPDEDHTDGKVAAETIRLLEQNRDRPFFIAAGFYRPHCPFIAPRKYFDLYPLDRIAAPPFSPEEWVTIPAAALSVSRPHFGVSVQAQREAIQAYYASISFLDANVGRLLDALERLGLAGNTIIVFWSDHGYLLGQHGQWMKMTLFEGSARNPLIIAGPGVAAGKVSRRPVELVDLYPTVADLAKLSDVPKNLAGRSLRPLLTNPKGAWDKPALTQVRRGAGENAFMGYSVRTERYRYTEWDEGRKGAELYDYTRDPNELRNLAGDSKYAKTVETLKRLLRSGRGARGPEPAAGLLSQAGVKTPDPDREFTRGPDISPSSRLLAWLDAELQRGESPGGPRRIRLPVSVTLDAAGGVASARIGVSDEADAIKVRLNDSALGISLADRARQMCGSGSRCAVWVEGFWRGRVNGAAQFDLRKVHRAIPNEELKTAIYLEVEKR